MIVFNLVCHIFWLTFLNLIDPNDGWSYANHNSHRFLIHNRFGNVITAPKVRTSPILYPKISESENAKCTEGICVPHQLCVNNTVITNGVGLLENRMSDSDSTTKEVVYCKDSESCCKLEEQHETDLDSIVIDKEIESNEIPPFENRQCGNRNYFGFESRISEGDIAEYSEFPWMILILTKLDNSSAFAYKCGGSLIHPSVVLTSAHCIDSIKPAKLIIRAGDWDTNNEDEKFPTQDRYVRSIVIHKGYSKSSLQNDIALLILTKPVELTENVNTICLPPADYKFDGRRCFVSGWGQERESGVYQSILKKVEVPVISNDVCQRQLRNTVLGKYFRLHRSFICAGGENGDSCKGDGGSPLMCNHPENEDTFYQVGIVAWGIGCNQLNVPAAYVNVAKFRRWIDYVIKRRDFDVIYYIGSLM